ncbi:Rv2175c family DNA-binding protein [Nocardioides sp.]|uniref:Rv2175c family DNA-binding protein n=1 Tax=Nocardioides sp. TaxID=35761 RepID=UPI0039E6E7A7
MEAPVRLADHDLSGLVTDWLDWAEVATALGVTVASVRTLIREHQLAAAVPTPGVKGAGQRVPALFLVDGETGPEILKGLPGVLTLMHDGGYDDRETIAWLFLDADLPGRPIDALRENRGSEVKRRAQAMAF